MPDGRTFSGARPLARLLATDPNYAHCLSEKLATFALGRGIVSADDRTIGGLAKGLTTSGFDFRELVKSMVGTDAFRKRRGEPAMAANPGVAK